MSLRITRDKRPDAERSEIAAPEGVASERLATPKPLDSRNIRAMSLTNPSLDKMIGLIRDSFRMRANTQSFYVDIGDNLARIGAQQHQVIFGRRGSGKSCLLMQYLKTADTKRIIPVYVLAD